MRFFLTSWFDENRQFSLIFAEAWWKDWWTDRLTNRSSYKDTRRHLVNLLYLLGHLFAQQVWSTNRCVLLTFFSTFYMDRRTDQQAYFPIEMPFYISVMFLGFPNEILEEKPSFLDFENNWLPSDRQTDRSSYRDARTHLKDGPGTVMVSDTLCPAVHILGT